MTHASPLLPKHAVPDGDDGAVGANGVGGEYEVHISSLNVLPSRQNFFWGGASPHPHGLVPAAGHLVPSEEADSGPPTPAGFGEEAKIEARSRASTATTVFGEAGDKLSEEDALSMRESVFNLSNTVLGVGVLSVPYAFRLSGYASLLLVLIVIAITGRTAVFIGSALCLAEKSSVTASVPRRARDFAFLAHVAFGSWGRVVIGAVTSLEIWFALVTFMVMNGVNASLVWPALGNDRAIIISCALSAVTVFVPMRIYSYLSLISSLALFVAAVAMIGAALTMIDWANPYNHIGQPALLRVENIPRSVGIIVFCFAGHPCFPIVHECMRDRRQWRLSVAMTFFLAFLYYGGLGVFGYLVFGTYLEASVTQNLARLQGALFWRNASAIAFLIKIQLTAPLLLNAILVSFWAPEAGAPEWPASRILVLLCLTALTALTAVAFADDVAAVASLTGSLFTMTTSVLFPALAHLRLVKLFGGAAERRWTSLTPHFLVLAFGIVMAILGTALSVKDVFGQEGR